MSRSGRVDVKTSSEDARCVRTVALDVFPESRFVFQNRVVATISVNILPRALNGFKRVSDWDEKVPFLKINPNFTSPLSSRPRVGHGSQRERPEQILRSESKAYRASERLSHICRATHKQKLESSCFSTAQSSRSTECSIFPLTSIILFLKRKFPKLYISRPSRETEGLRGLKTKSISNPRPLQPTSSKKTAFILTERKNKINGFCDEKNVY